MKAGRGTFGAARAFPIRERCLLSSSTRQALAPSDPVVRKSVGAPPLGDLFGTARTVPFDRSARRSFRPPDPRGRSGPTRKLARAPTCVNLTEGFAPQRIHHVRAGSGTENAPIQRVTRRGGGSSGTAERWRRPAFGPARRHRTASHQCISITITNITEQHRRVKQIRDADENEIEQTGRINTPPAAVNDATVVGVKMSRSPTRRMRSRLDARGSSTPRTPHPPQPRAERTRAPRSRRAPP
jgi:hypothetical protein